MPSDHVQDYNGTKDYNRKLISSTVHEGSSINNFKVVCIFVKVEFVRYMSEYVYCLVIIGLEL